MCRHPVLHFEQGGLLVVCSDPECKAAWMAVDDTRLIFDYMRRAEGLTEQDVRKDPLSASRFAIDSDQTP